MATNSSNMKTGFFIYMGLSSLSIVQKVVVAISGKIPGCCRGVGGNDLSNEYECYNDSLDNLK